MAMSMLVYRSVKVGHFSFPSVGLSLVAVTLLVAGGSTLGHCRWSLSHCVTSHRIFFQQFRSGPRKSMSLKAVQKVTM